MKIHNKFNPCDGRMPDLAMQVAEAECHHCGSKMRFPVPETFIDWQKVAEQYREIGNRTIERFGQIVADIDVMNPRPNPIREYISNEWAAILGELGRGGMGK